MPVPPPEDQESCKIDLYHATAHFEVRKFVHNAKQEELKYDCEVRWHRPMKGPAKSTGWVQLIRSLLSATFSFELSGFSN